MSIFKSKASRKLFLAQCCTIFIAAMLIYSLDFYLKDSSQSFIDYLKENTPILAVFIGIILISFPYINRLQSTPINKLIKAAKELKRKGRTSIVDIKSGDEFEQLADAFNQMSYSITKQIKDLEKAQARLEESNQVKARFLSNLSHELRTPLNVISVSSEFLMEDETLNEESKDFSKMIFEGSQVLKTHLNHIFQLQDSLDSSRDNVQADFYLKEMAELVIKPYLEIIEEKKLDFEINIPNDLHGVEYHGYYYRLMSLISLLLDNSVKFTTFGFIRIEAFSQMLDRNKDIVTFTISDSGKGISNLNIEKLTSPFVQGDDSDTKEFMGLGLGLALAQNHLKFFGSSLQIDSTEGKGSRFSFELILDRTQPRLGDKPS